MFTYLNPEIRRRLIQQGKWVQIDSLGNILDSDTEVSSDTKVTHLLGPVPLPVCINNKHYSVSWYVAANNAELQTLRETVDNPQAAENEKDFAELVSSTTVNSILVIGNPKNSESPLVRVHSNCITGDVFGSERCECGAQLNSAIEKISADENGGLIIYMGGHEGRGIGLWAKAAAYLLQDEGENTYQANESLGLPVDSRDFSVAATLILYFLGNRPLRLLTNNPKKVDDLNKYGVTHIQAESHVSGINDRNRRYVQAKKSWGHDIDENNL